MKKIFNFFLIFIFILVAGWQSDKVFRIVTESAKIADAGDRISYISEQFMNTPYAADTLKGSADKPEEFVVDLDGMDCTTYIEYVEALRLSAKPDSFVQNLKNVRYFGGEVSYPKRRHFFTDWVSGENNSVRDVTPELPGSVTVEKYINRKSDSSNWLNSVPNTMRMVTYVPKEKIDKELIKLLHTGDYIGVYSDKAGLDVSHVGIFIRSKSGEFFRNASSKAMKVTDYVFKDYVNEIQGIIVFRAK